ncbi:nocobactin polyketide synthase NbtC [Mycobacterium paragordonae]|uniref:Nocobactin polyketide synthase NbtC n=1 Tax=Mycobacterium paragordonae TaxID=1389713 RepID=A0AAJ1S2Z1_9MYCO|nr:nocobactin polyketide synthase NbtC [Mycobacterium paragordonae]
MTRYLLPNGAIPVLLTSDNPELIPVDAAALLAYLADHPEATPHLIAAMLFRTRVARKHRVLALVRDREELTEALRAIVDGREHGSVLRADAAAAARRHAYVFPGQGSQRPGMGRRWYDSVPAYRAEVERCAAVFAELTGQSPLDYLLNDQFVAPGDASDDARTVQPALFTQMAGLAAVWRSFGVAPAVTIGHSQGEVAAAYVSGRITLADAVRVIALRARAADGLGAGDYAMAVLATDRETCEDLVARCAGWAQVSAVNSPNMHAISGDRESVQSIVDTCAARDVFARMIPVRYPAHTGLINGLRDELCTGIGRELSSLTFSDSDIACLGATLGGPLTPEQPVDQYWFWNLRNTVRFDKAMTAARSFDIDTYIELAEHPTLQLAIQENLTHDAGRNSMVVGTSTRTDNDLTDFTRNLMRCALHDLNYPWDSLATESQGPPALPLPDFPNTPMNEIALWMPYEQGLSPAARKASAAGPNVAEPDVLGPTVVGPNVVAPDVVVPDVVAPEENLDQPAPRMLAEKWVRLSRRSLVPPRTIGIIDHTGAAADLAAALTVAAGDVGATARVLSADEIRTAPGDLNACVILLPRSAQGGASAAVHSVATFFAERRWWPGVVAGITDYWLVTVGGEAVVNGDPPPDLAHAGASAGFRCVGATYPGTRFRHLDIPDAGPAGPAEAVAIVAALHTAEESELALRDGGLYAKRVVDHDAPVTGTDDQPAGHVLIVGGTGKLGLEFCEHFARRGAREITLLNRSGETASAAQRLQTIRSATGIDIRVVACDVNDTAAVSALSEQATPADLIIHAAVEYSGIELPDITAAAVDHALQAKVVGIARVLHTFPRAEGCRVVLCSSISASVGGRGLALYAAGNRMLDAMAYQLRAEGLDCVSVQWGHWRVHLEESGSAMLAGLGVVPMRPADALAVNVSGLRGNAIVAAFELHRARSVLEACGRGSLLSQLNSAAQRPAEPPARPRENGAGLSQRLVSLLAQAIGADSADTIDIAVPMVAIGLDSLQALEFRRRVKAELNRDLEVADLLGGATIAELLAKLDA